MQHSLHPYPRKKKGTIVNHVLLSTVCDQESGRGIKQRSKKCIICTWCNFEAFTGSRTTIAGDGSKFFLTEKRTEPCVIFYSSDNFPRSMEQQELTITPQ